MEMLCDEREFVRQLAVMQIIKARSTDNNQVPTLTFNANDYTDIIDWLKIAITEPSITKKKIVNKI